MTNNSTCMRTFFFTFPRHSWQTLCNNLRNPFGIGFSLYSLCKNFSLTSPSYELVLPETSYQTCVCWSCLLCLQLVYSCPDSKEIIFIGTYFSFCWQAINKLKRLLKFLIGVRTFAKQKELFEHNKVSAHESLCDSLVVIPLVISDVFFSDWL